MTLNYILSLFYNLTISKRRNNKCFQNKHLANSHYVMKLYNIIQTFNLLWFSNVDKLLFCFILGISDIYYIMIYCVHILLCNNAFT